MGVGTSHDDLSRLNRLAERFEDLTVKFWELVHEQNAIVGEADFPGFRTFPTADNRWHGGCVVGFAEGSRAADPALV
jgi:hypothetical protein